jgi:hypothetical protein
MIKQTAYNLSNYYSINNSFICIWIIHSFVFVPLDDDRFSDPINIT